jgi:hypothetical protein
MVGLNVRVHPCYQVRSRRLVLVLESKLFSIHLVLRQGLSYRSLGLRAKECQKIQTEHDYL